MQYLRPAHLSACALEERTRRRPRGGDTKRGGSWPCPKCAQQCVSGCPAAPCPLCPALFPRPRPPRPWADTRGVCAPQRGTRLRLPAHRLAAAGIPAPGFVTKLSWAHAVSEVAPPTPFGAPRPGRGRTVVSPARGSSEVPAASRWFGPRRRPAGPRAAADAAAATAGAAAAPARSCSAAVLPQPREAQSPAPAARRVPTVATPPRLRARGPRTRRRESARAGLSQLRGAGDPRSLQDGRGFPPTGRF